MFFLIFLQVVLRYGFLRPLAWSEEASRYLMVWIICLAASDAYGHGQHVGVTLIQRALSVTKQRYLSIFIHVTVSVLMGVIAYQGFQLSFYLLDQNSPSLDIQMTWPYLALPVGALLIIVQAVGLAWHEIKTNRPDE